MQLLSPSERYFSSFQQSVGEWERKYQDGAGIRDLEAIRHRDGFREWVSQLRAEEDHPAQEGFVTCTYFWIIENEQYLGSIVLRHHLNAYLENFGGHIGYSVRPSARSRGVATQALKSTLALAAQRKISSVLLTCSTTNKASQRVIENNGGVLENKVSLDGEEICRYWAPTGLV